MNADASTPVVEPAGPGDAGRARRWLRVAGYAFGGFLVAIAVLLHAWSRSATPRVPR